MSIKHITSAEEVGHKRIYPLRLHLFAEWEKATVIWWSSEQCCRWEAGSDQKRAWGSFRGDSHFSISWWKWQLQGCLHLSKLGVVYLSSMHLLVGPFDLSKIIPLCGTSEQTSYRGRSVFSYWFSNKEVTDDHLFGETQRKLRWRQREP